MKIKYPEKKFRKRGDRTLSGREPEGNQEEPVLVEEDKPQNLWSSTKERDLDLVSITIAQEEKKYH